MRPVPGAPSSNTCLSCWNPGLGAPAVWEVRLSSDACGRQLWRRRGSSALTTGHCAEGRPTARSFRAGAATRRRSAARPAGRDGSALAALVARCRGRGSRPLERVRSRHRGGSSRPLASAAQRAPDAPALAVRHARATRALAHGRGDSAPFRGQAHPRLSRTTAERAAGAASQARLARHLPRSAPPRPRRALLAICRATSPALSTTRNSRTRMTP